MVVTIVVVVVVVVIVVVIVAIVAVVIIVVVVVIVVCARLGGKALSHSSGVMCQNCFVHMNSLHLQWYHMPELLCTYGFFFNDFSHVSSCGSSKDASPSVCQNFALCTSWVSW